MKHGINELSDYNTVAHFISRARFASEDEFNQAVNDKRGLIELLNPFYDDYLHKSLCEDDSEIVKTYPEFDYDVYNLLDDYGFGLDYIPLEGLSDPDTINFANDTDHGFYTLDQVNAIIDHLVTEYDYIHYATPSYSNETRVIGQTEGYVGDQGTDSFGAQDIKAIRITNNESNEDPQTLFTGMHHAREPMSFMSIIYYVLNLIEGKANNDPLVNALLDNRELTLIPIINQDVSFLQTCVNWITHRYRKDTLSARMEQKEAEGDMEAAEFIRKLSPIACKHINFNGIFLFKSDEKGIDVDATLKLLDRIFTSSVKN